jgi:eukaryotic-like serine/threonine-protein kinase
MPKGPTRSVPVHCPTIISELITTRYTLGMCLWNLDRQDEARPHLQEALAFFVTNPDRFGRQIDEIRGLGM